MKGPSQEETIVFPLFQHGKRGYKVTCLILMARAFTNFTVAT